MAIKVIERKPRKITCPNCKAKLEFEITDIQTKKYENMLGEEYSEDYINCPDCDTYIKI